MVGLYEIYIGLVKISQYFKKSLNKTLGGSTFHLYDQQGNTQHRAVEVCIQWCSLPLTGDRIRVSTVPTGDWGLAWIWRLQ